MSHQDIIHVKSAFLYLFYLKINKSKDIYLTKCGSLSGRFFFHCSREKKRWGIKLLKKIRTYDSADNQAPVFAHTVIMFSYTDACFY